MRNSVFSRGLRAGLGAAWVWAVLSGAWAHAAPTAPRVDQSAPFADWRAKMDAGHFGRDALAALQRAARGAPADQQPRYAALLARHEREYLGDPVAALRRLAPLLLPTNAVAAWQNRLAPAARPTRSTGPARGAATAAVAPPPPWPSLPARDIPAAQAAASIEAAVEAAYAWNDLGDPAQALALVEAWGRMTTDGPRARASECQGDLLLAGGRIGPALECYRMALTLLEPFSSRTEGLSAEQRQAVERLRRAIAAAEHRAKIERYGPGWMAYYEARVQDLRERNSLRALRAYDRILRDYPKTPYAEAAACYGIRLLLDLSLPESQGRVREILGKEERELVARSGRVADMRRTGVAPHRLAVAEERLVLDRAALAELKAIPLGSRAAAEAQARAQAFQTARPRGLYRGETQLDLARWTLEARVEPAAARERYAAAWAWIEDVGRGEAALDAFEVPHQAADVSKPPAQAVVPDGRGRVREVGIEPGMVVNRRTCAWYLDGLRREAALALGLLAWIENDKKTAAQWYARAEACDPRGRILRAQGGGGAGHRLKQALEHDRLHADPEEASRYRGRERAAVTLAEFHYCVDRPDRVLALTDRLLAGEFGPMDARKAQYPRLLRGLARHAQGDRVKAVEELGLALGGPWTTTHDRAAFAASNILWAMNRKVDAAQLLDRLARASRQNDYVHRAQLALGLRMASAGDTRQALQWLGRVPQHATTYYALARQYMKPLEPVAKTPLNKPRP